MGKVGVRRAVFAGVVAAGFSVLAPSASAYTPGWYLEADGFYTQPLNANGTTYQPAIAGTPGTPGTPGTAGSNCLLGNLLGLGSLLTGGGEGCLLSLLGPGTSPTDPTDPTRSAERGVGKECVSTGGSRWSPYN